MASNKRTTFQIERDRREIANLYLQGWTQSHIAEHLKSDADRDYELSQQMISYDLQRVQEEWKKSALIDFDDAKAKELAKVDRLEREYWDAWIASQDDAVTETKEKYMAGTDSSTANKRLKEQEKRVGQVGDPAYLRGVQWCIEKRCAILGLDAPKKTELTGAGGEPLINDDRYDRALSQLAEVLRKSVPDQGTGANGDLDTAE